LLDCLVCRSGWLVVVFVSILFVVDYAVGGFPGGTQRPVAAYQATAEFERDLFIDRAGMRLFLMHPQFGEHINDDARFYFKLPRQLVDSDFPHRREQLDNSLNHCNL